MAGASAHTGLEFPPVAGLVGSGPQLIQLTSLTPELIRRLADGFVVFFSLHWERLGLRLRRGAGTASAQASSFRVAPDAYRGPFGQLQAGAI